MFVRNLARAAALRPSAAGILRRAVTAPICSELPSRTSSFMRCGTSRAASSATGLAKVLREEFTAEESLAVMDDQLQSMVDLLKSKGIIIKDEPGSSMVRLFGPGIGGEKIMIEFSCQEEGEGDDEGWENDDEDQSDQQQMTSEELAEKMRGEDDDEEGPQAGFRFVATVTKGTKKLAFDGTATHKITLTSITHCPVTADHNNEDLYHGPLFEELEPKVQDAMYAYLKERNIGDEMAVFICMYADHKEQKEYLNWLKEIEAFIK